MNFIVFIKLRLTCPAIRRVPADSATSATPAGGATSGTTPQEQQLSEKSPVVTKLPQSNLHN